MYFPIADVIGFPVIDTQGLAARNECLAGGEMFL
jgi:hypothetical protein